MYRQSIDRHWDHNGPGNTRQRYRYHSKRHAMLLTTIRNRFRENNSRPLEIEQLCVPLNRYKMATTFCALLSLEAKQYIVMQSAPDSVELDTITPGPRLWDL